MTLHVHVNCKSGFSREINDRLLKHGRWKHDCFGDIDNVFNTPDVGIGLPVRDRVTRCSYSRKPVQVCQNLANGLPGLSRARNSHKRFQMDYTVFETYPMCEIAVQKKTCRRFLAIDWCIKRLAQSTGCPVWRWPWTCVCTFDVYISQQYTCTGDSFSSQLLTTPSKKNVYPLHTNK